ncbi:MAG: lipoyl(octanoyl) transferase LipB [Candidatus Accumulibacter sp.]|jgi:lipoyl(octanoyl) transferase|nr:lipoyl(octanoyl) transferase LipB [Accumulibacter sp.]
MSILVQSLGRIDYALAWQAMIDFTAARTETTPDELWLCEHPPVYTLGQAGRPEHRLVDNGIPLIKIDRGGQITYHGPGQVVVYTLLDLRRRVLGVRALVTLLEQAVIELLADHDVVARRLDGAPGVYVDRDGGAAYPAKIAALGLRVRRGCSYHGLSLNVDMDLAPFSAIDPCGHAGMSVTQTRDLSVDLAPVQIGEALVRHLIRQLENPNTDRRHR